MSSHKFLAWGPKRAPEVHLLTADEANEYWNRLMQPDIPDGFAEACSFGLRIHYAVPVVQQAMEELALGYNGPHAERLKYMAACLALGRPIEPPSDDGGQPAMLTPVPNSRPPSGSKVELMEAVK